MQHVDLLLVEKKEQQAAFARMRVVDRRVALVVEILAARSTSVVAYSEVVDMVDPVLVEIMNDPAVVLVLLLVVV